MEENLISVITPCLNGEKLIHRFLESLLNQTYKNFELIFVDDGSTDKTKEVLFSYKKKFDNLNIDLIYIYQENKGQASAINAGLKKVNGKYLCWPDCDDYLESKSFEKRVRILEEFSEYGIVTSDAFVRKIEDLSTVIRLGADNQPEKFEKNQFDLLLSGNSMFLPGTHMVRMSCFDRAHPNRMIIPCKGGQNWQILLPIFYFYKRYFLDEPLYNYIIYQSSHSQGDITLVQKIFRFNEHEGIIVKTLNSMNIAPVEKEKYIFDTKIRYTRKRLTVAFLHRNNSMISKEYFILKANNQKRIKEFIYYIISKNVFIHRLFLKILPLLR